MKEKKGIKKVPWVWLILCCCCVWRNFFFIFFFSRHFFLFASTSTQERKKKRFTCFSRARARQENQKTSFLLSSWIQKWKLRRKPGDVSLLLIFNIFGLDGASKRLHSLAHWCPMSTTMKENDKAFFSQFLFYCSTANCCFLCDNFHWPQNCCRFFILCFLNFSLAFGLP